MDSSDMSSSSSLLLDFSSATFALASSAALASASALVLAASATLVSSDTLVLRRAFALRAFTDFEALASSCASVTRVW